MPGSKAPQYPFARQEPAGAPPPEAVHSLHRRLETQAGAAAPPTPPPPEFLQRQRQNSSVDSAPAVTRVPRWLYARIERRAPDHEIARDIIARLRRAPSERGLRETGDLLNEMGRRPGGGRVIRDLITQELVDEFQKKEG